MPTAATVDKITQCQRLECSGKVPFELQADAYSLTRCQPTANAVPSFTNIPSLLLHDRRPSSDRSTSSDVTDLQLHNFTTAQLAVDRQIEECPILQSSMLVEKEPSCPNIARFQQASDNKYNLLRSKPEALR